MNAELKEEIFYCFDLHRLFGKCASDERIRKIERMICVYEKTKNEKDQNIGIVLNDEELKRQIFFGFNLYDEELERDCKASIGNEKIKEVIGVYEKKEKV